MRAWRMGDAGLPPNSGCSTPSTPTRLADLAALVAIPSVGGTPAEGDAQAWCGDRLRGLGLAVDEWDIDIAAEQRPRAFPGWRSSGPRRAGAWRCWADPPCRTARVRAGAGPCGHTDVVPPGDLARWPAAGPFELRLEDGGAYGRGACDMKGGLVAVLGPWRVGAGRVRPARPLAVHTVSGEEDGGAGGSPHCGGGTARRPASSPSRRPGRSSRPMPAH